MAITLKAMAILVDNASAAMSVAKYTDLESDWQLAEDAIVKAECACAEYDNSSHLDWLQAHHPTLTSVQRLLSLGIYFHQRDFWHTSTGKKKTSKKSLKKIGKIRILHCWLLPEQ